MSPTLTPFAMPPPMPSNKSAPSPRSSTVRASRNSVHLRDKPLDEFLNCIRIKTRGLYNLLIAVPPARLKALHVISSVLGNSGMRGQTDYTFANAWLDEAVQHIQTAHPHLHCLSLGYSVWADTGMGKRLGALDTLRSVGVTPIGLQEGVAAYRQLLKRSNPAQGSSSRGG